MDSDPDHMRLGPYAVMHAIADRVVDSYMEVSDLVETDIDAMEQNVFSPRSSTDIEHIYMLKREVVELRRAISPLTGALSKLTQDHSDLITKEVRRYLRDVLDHQSHAADQIGSYDEMLTSLVNAALGKVAMQQNTDMRKISAWVGIAAFPTMLAGIYGMNFEHMPELAEPAAYPIVLLVMVVVCTLLYRNFRKNGWL
jgi:magnesium transporter